MTDFQQFAALTWPTDIIPLEPWNRQELQETINKKRRMNNLQELNLSGKIKINYNSFFFRPDEINIHTTDFFFDYSPDFDWINIGDEIDPWRRTCRLKIEYQRFQQLGIDSIRTDGTLQRVHVCEGLTLFEDSYKNLIDKGEFKVKFLDLSKMFEIAVRDKASIKRLEVLEKEIFTQSDPTGAYYNKTIWTFDRIKWYLEKVGFTLVQLDAENSDEMNTAVIAIK